MATSMHPGLVGAKKKIELVWLVPLHVHSGFWCARLTHVFLAMNPHLLRLDKPGYDAHMIADRFPQRGMFDVQAPGSVGLGGEAH
jgi:hypothetical protein